VLAATANIHGVPLLTHNTSDFQIISDLTDAREPSALQATKSEPDEEQEEPPAM
jgi:toxin FitB